MKKNIILGGFALAGLIVVPVFLLATSYLHLAVASFLYLTIIWLSFKYFPRQTPALAAQTLAVSPPPPPTTKNRQPPAKPAEILDVEKRDFLKMVVAAGFSFFVFSIFSRRAEALLFGRAAVPEAVALADPEGNKIFPPERQPTDGYQISEIDEDDFLFCGFTSKNGGWYIVKQDAEKGSFRYTKGSSNFPLNWSNRKRLHYDYFHQVFS